MTDRRAGNGSRSTETAALFRQRGLLYRRGRRGASGSTAASLKNAQDYFITKRSGLPWSTIPDFVVGRAGVDNWLMVTALARRAAVVDASRTVTARHQVRSGYEPAAHFSQPAGDAAVNYVLAGRRFDYSLALTDCAPLETSPAASAAGSTSTDADGQISGGDCDGSRTAVLVRRRTLSRYCRRAYVKLRALHQLSRAQFLGNITRVN